MGAWLSNISLKYKFWAVNAVAFVTTLFLVLYAVHLEQQARAEEAQNKAQVEARLLATWPAGQPLPQDHRYLSISAGQTRASMVKPTRPERCTRLGRAEPFPSAG